MAGSLRMRDLAPTLLTWLDEGRRFALAVVIQTSGSAPRSAGSMMAVREDQLILGSVSGGCVESSVIQSALRSLSSGRGELLSFGPESEAALFEVGLSCGGEIRVWVFPASDQRTALSMWLRQFGLRGEVTVGLRLDPDQPLLIVEPVPSSSEDLYVARFPAAPKLVIVGAVHIAVALVRLAAGMGWETVVIDPREALARPERFPESPGQLFAEWPHAALGHLEIDEDTCLVALTHDAKIDEDALLPALKSRAGYVGALGGKKTQERRRAALAAKGISEAELTRLRGPVGLDIGAQSPEEIALSIVAEIVQLRRKSS